MSSDDSVGGVGDHAYRDAVKERYRFSEWAGRVAASGPARRFTLDHTALGELEFEGRRAVTEGDAYADVFDHPTEGARISVEVWEFQTPSDAHEALVDLLASSMAVELPPGADRGLDLGEVCFCDWGDPPTAVYFTRGHVLVRVENAGTVRVPVGDVAAAVDAQLAATVA